MWELDHKEVWALKNWCFRIVVLEKTLEISLDSMEIKPINPKGNQPWTFIGRTAAEAEAQIFWPSEASSQLIGKDSDAGKDWGPEEKGAAEDKMVGWHHPFNRHRFEQILGDSEGQGSLVCCSSWSHKELDTQPSDWTIKFIWKCKGPTIAKISKRRKSRKTFRPLKC